MTTPTIYWIDLFCGAGGTTTGIHLANANADVVACVNHDKNAIESHKTNHPNCLHFTEDVRDFRVVERLKILVSKLRKETPGCFINLWASLECTNYSKAKGGLPRDADSRTLANSLFMYIEELSPDYLYVENVREFMAAYGIVDIKMRMFHIAEMLRIQGFPKGYILKGTKTNQKKQIGNAVEVHQAIALIESNFKALENHLKIAV